MRARRFFATLNLAPASRNCWRSTVDWATVMTRLRTITTVAAFDSVAFSADTASAFSARSMPVSPLLPEGAPKRATGRLTHAKAVRDESRLSFAQRCPMGSVKPRTPAVQAGDRGKLFPVSADIGRGAVRERVCQGVY